MLRFSLFVIAILLGSLPLATKADCQIGNILPPCACGGNCQLQDFLALGSNLVLYGLGILSIFVIFFIIYGGYILITAMGNTERIDKGKKILGGVFRGMTIVMIAWVLINTVVFLLTGNTNGEVFGGGPDKKRWWQFETTPPYCPPGQSKDSTGKTITVKRVCQDTSTFTPQDILQYQCQNEGVCPGDQYQQCCNGEKQQGSSVNWVMQCNVQNTIICPNQSSGTCCPTGSTCCIGQYNNVSYDYCCPQGTACNGVGGCA